MPRRERELATVVPFPSRALVASATNYPGSVARLYNNDVATWQAECYRHYRICGEARFSAQFFGHALSKAVLFIADPADPSGRAENGPAAAALGELFNGPDGQQAMLAAIGTHLTVAGECYLIGRVDVQPNGDPIEVWEIRSVLEVKSSGIKGTRNSSWWIDQGGGQPRIELKDTDSVIRIWIPDPAHAFQADSPFRSLLPILEEIEWLTKYVFAQCSSRLAGAGMAIFPEEIEFPAAPTTPGQQATNKGTADNLMALLAENMLKPIKDPSNPAAKVPIIATAPGEHIGNIQWIKFWTELDTEAKGLRQEAIQRFALGMDFPPERILGMAGSVQLGGGGGRGVNHWGSWQIDEDTIKMHVEPMLDVVVQALSFAYVRPVSRDPNALVGYDTSKLRLRPDRSQESIELWDRGLLKAEVMVRENGFASTDLMDPEERKQWFLWKVASGSATPDMVNAALAMLGLDLGPAGDQSGDNNQSRPAPTLIDHPGRELPDPNESEAGQPSYSALLAASDALVYRALERAGNRLRQGGVKPPGVRSFEVHTATTLSPSQAFDSLGDAWACAEPVLDGLTEDLEGHLRKLNSYTVGLLTSSQPHTRDALARWLATTT